MNLSDIQKEHVLTKGHRLVTQMWKHSIHLLSMHYLDYYRYMYRTLQLCKLSWTNNSVHDANKHKMNLVDTNESVTEPPHEIMVLFVLRKIIFSNAHAQPSSGAGCLIFGRTLPLLPYFMCANSEGSDEDARMRRLSWTFTGRLCEVP